MSTSGARTRAAANARGPDQEPAVPPAGYAHLFVGLVACLLLWLPLYAVKFPPSTDLPQQLVLVRLFWDALQNPDSIYAVQWLTPHMTAHVVLMGVVGIVGYELAGRVTLGLIVGISVAAICMADRRRGGTGAHALLASCFIISTSLYWGFLSFAIGFPVFLLYVGTLGEAGPGRSLRDAPAQPLRELSRTAAWSLALYFTHLLWVIPAVATAGLHWLACSRNRTRLWTRMGGHLPGLALALIWRAGIEGTANATPPIYLYVPTRLLPERLGEAALGGARGLPERLIFVLILLWMLLVVVGHRREILKKLDPSLAVAAAVLGLLYIGAPDKWNNTIQLHQRWAPYMLATAILALPAIKWRPRFSWVFGCVTLATFALWTLVAWARFEDRELAGLDDALRRLPAGRSVAGLSHGLKSPRIRGYPYLQMFSYAEAWKGCPTNFNFAVHQSSAVVMKDPHWQPRITRNLEWAPQSLQASDLDHLEYLLVRGGERDHAFYLHQRRLQPLGEPAPWRLYRVTDPPTTGPE